MFTLDYTPYKLRDWVNKYKNILDEGYSVKSNWYSFQRVYK